MHPSSLNDIQSNASPLGIDKLVSVFKSTTATYKFYWLISIVELVEQGVTEIPLNRIYARMISNSWFTINYFHVSFGKADQLQEMVKQILIWEPQLSVSSSKDEINHALELSSNKSTQGLLKLLGRNVPHWFLSSWFPKQKQSEIIARSQIFDQDCLYALFRNHIVINPIWLEFLKQNAKLIKDFCFWNLSLYLQARNPNVPDIPNKLIKDAVRNGLGQQTNHYWKLVFQELGAIDCIYTGKRLSIENKNFSIDHFVPYSFVSHDLIWNLYPIDKSENSRKSNYLPNINTHFDPFYELQNQAFEIVKSKDPQNRFLEDYLPISPNLISLPRVDLLNTVQPLITIAQNNGFQYYN